MFNRQRGKDPVESKRGNKWMAQDPGGDKKGGTERTGGAGFEQGKGCAMGINVRECACRKR